MSLHEDDVVIYTLNDVAKELGLSKSTVSRAISGKGNLSLETRERVQKFIKQHNFQPNAVAKSLAQNKTFNIGLVLPQDYSATEPIFFQDCMTGICEVASEHDYDILISITGNGSTEQLERIINNRKVDGVIVTRSTINSQSVRILRAKQLPFVVIGPAPDPDVLYVDNNNQEACRELTMLLLMRGVQKIALLGGNETHLVTKCRLKGFEAAYTQLNLHLNEDLVFRDVTDHAKAQKAVDKIIPNKVDCIICMDDYICIMALLRLRELGIQVPEDIQIASFYDSGSLANNIPSITSLKFNTRELGRMACQKLLERLNEDKEESCTLPQFEINWRDSTK